MLVKSQIKYIQSLGHKKFRDQEGVFVAEGPKGVEELLRATNLRPVHVFAVAEWLGEERPGIRSLPPSAITSLRPEELERISSLTTPNQVIVVFTKPDFPSFAFGDSLSLLLDGIQDPGNLGTILRIADWFGIRQVACSRDCADVFNAKTVQSTMGSICRVGVVYEDLPAMVARYPGLPVFGATLDGRSVYEVERPAKGMIVIGNESKGIRPELLEAIRVPVTIPRIGKAESLNAAVAAGIILSHLVG
jgi:RNA methyltransferase, TrmH family